MKIRAGSWSVAMAVVATALAAPSAEAQWAEPDRDARRPGMPVAWVGASLVGADPVGEFGEVVSEGWGGSVWGALPLTDDGVVRLRAEGGFLIYGHESKSVCFPAPVGCRIGVELTTNNSIFHLGVGPEIAFPGRVEPYVNATAGFSYFATTSSLSGIDDDHEDLFETRNYEDFVGAFTFGGGLRARVSSGRTPVAIDMGVRYHRNGVAEYLREGDIVDEPDGSITIYPNRSEANLVAFQLGVSVGIPRGDDDRQRGHHH